MTAATLPYPAWRQHMAKGARRFPVPAPLSWFSADRNIIKPADFFGLLSTVTKSKHVNSRVFIAALVETFAGEGTRLLCVVECNAVLS